MVCKCSYQKVRSHTLPCPGLSGRRDSIKRALSGSLPTMAACWDALHSTGEFSHCGWRWGGAGRKVCSLQERNTFLAHFHCHLLNLHPPLCRSSLNTPLLNETGASKLLGRYEGLKRSHTVTVMLLARVAFLCSALT